MSRARMSGSYIDMQKVNMIDSQDWSPTYSTGK
jgi:hypothetical protein